MRAIPQWPCTALRVPRSILKFEGEFDDLQEARSSSGSGGPMVPHGFDIPFRRVDCEPPVDAVLRELPAQIYGLRSIAEAFYLYNIFAHAPGTVFWVMNDMVVFHKAPSPVLRNK